MTNQHCKLNKNYAWLKGPMTVDVAKGNLKVECLECKQHRYTVNTRLSKSKDLSGVVLSDLLKDISEYFHLIFELSKIYN
jgi:hypothetical protein